MKELATMSFTRKPLASMPSPEVAGSDGSLANGGTQFPYKPLSRNVDSIRLIILKPHDETEHASIVRCELSHVTFGEKPQYEALSYTWGDPTDLKDIIIDGLKMKVRANLYTALWHLRTQKPRVLWADAICINQSNFQERTYQVGLMDYIYTRASCVPVWLGTYHQLNGQVVDEVVLHGTQYDRQCVRFFEILVSHKYWTRLWIIQEFALSMNLKVCVGVLSLEWRDFMHRISSVFIGRNHGNIPLIKQLDSKRMGRHTQTNRLEVLMEDFQYARCAEPRDKVYGFLGMAHDCQGGIIKADYTKPLFDLYADVIEFFCQRRKLQNGTSNDLDRSMRVVRFSQLVQKLLGGVTYNVAKPTDTTSSQPALVYTSRIVQARAAITGEILDIGPAYQEMISSSSANKRWRLCFEKRYSLPSHIQTLREASEAYSLVLLDMTDQELAKIRSIHPFDMYTKGIVAKSAWNGDEKRWDHQELDNQTGRDMDDIPSNTVLPSLTLVNEPHMFLGSNHLIGLAPFEAAPGDKICQFWKSNVVGLLRKEKDNDVYRLIGRLDLSRGYLEDLKPLYREPDELEKGELSVIIQMDIRALSVMTF